MRGGQGVTEAGGRGREEGERGEGGGIGREGQKMGGRMEEGGGRRERRRREGEVREGGKEGEVREVGKLRRGREVAAGGGGPGPGRYYLPSTVGFTEHDCTKLMRPAYSFGRLEGQVKFKDWSPGPAYYINPKITRTGADGTPIYSMLGRQRDPNTFKSPSATRYFPEKVHPQGEKHAPKYSISARTRYRRQDQNPAPSKYQLPPVLGNRQPYKDAAPAYNITSRQQVGSYLEDLAKAPGPGNYKSAHLDLYKSMAPLYSMRSRSYAPGDTTKKPGPGAHSPERVVINRAVAPKYSLGIRHSEFVAPLITDCDF
ncbi:hypothetical protein FSP39_002067 [Pinctada imbricata]|uniref:Uncharacterized protein n=1 Tax=Pinctada imbricata TaxID=66713 RepID=A0AA88YGW8_PINIB|nr:hypothetical protein FSP39_002067 [Pinctada imbricata]